MAVDLSGREILVVEDVRFTRATIVRMLNQMGTPTVIEAEDGAVALDRLTERGASVDCVLTDLDMPKVDGLQLLKAVRVGTGVIPRSMKVVALTGHSELDRLGPALLLDIDAIITKPTSRRALEECFERLFAAGVTMVDAGADTYRAVELSPQEAVPAGHAIPSRHYGGNERRVSLSGVSANSRLTRDLLFHNGRLLLRSGTLLSDRHDRTAARTGSRRRTGRRHLDRRSVLERLAKLAESPHARELPPSFIIAADPPLRDWRNQGGRPKCG